MATVQSPQFMQQVSHFSAALQSRQVLLEQFGPGCVAGIGTRLGL